MTPIISFLIIFKNRLFCSFCFALALGEFGMVLWFFTKSADMAQRHWLWFCWIFLSWLPYLAPLDRCTYIERQIRIQGIWVCYPSLSQTDPLVILCAQCIALIQAKPHNHRLGEPALGWSLKSVPDIFQGSSGIQTLDLWISSSACTSYEWMIKN